MEKPKANRSPRLVAVTQAQPTKRFASFTVVEKFGKNPFTGEDQVLLALLKRAVQK